MNHRRIDLLACLAAVCFLLGSCGGRGPHTPQPSDHRDIRKAQEIYERAVAHIDGDPARAEALLREALGYDLYHGAAHNNLGVLLLGEGRLYDAAQEFEWARKLLPGDPEPRVNLAITLTRGGKHTDAIDAARSALEVRPGHLGATRVLAHIQIREGLEDESTKGYLDDIINRSDDPDWKDWATRQRLRLVGRQFSP